MSRSSGSQAGFLVGGSGSARKRCAEFRLDQLVQVAVDAVALDAALQGERIGAFQLLHAPGLVRHVLAMQLVGAAFRAGSRPPRVRTAATAMPVIDGR
jgi:hypothetical protein